jgi:hypothetical protein
VDELDHLRALERDIAHEWWWPNGAPRSTAQVSRGDPGAYWQMLPQQRASDRKRVESARRLAAIIGPPIGD